jgi:hypothetical protein
VPPETERARRQGWIYDFLREVGDRERLVWETAFLGRRAGEGEVM